MIINNPPPSLCGKFLKVYTPDTPVGTISGTGTFHRKMYFVDKKSPLSKKNLLSMKCLIYEMSYVLSMKCPIYEMSVLSMKCLIYEIMSYL